MGLRLVGGLLTRDPIAGLVSAVAGGVVVAAHVQPRAGRTQVAGRHGEALRIRVAAPPVDGRATEAARIALATALGIAPSAVSLVAGERSRLKRFRVEGLTVDDAADRLRVLLAPAGDDRSD